MVEILAKRLKDLRTDAHLTQTQFGALLSVSQDTISLWETGRAIPTTETLVLICRTFDVSADYLLGLRDY